MLETDQSRAECNRFRDFNHPALFHLANGLQGLWFVGNRVHFLEDLV